VARHNCAAGAWHSVFPNWLNVTGLLADEWRGNVSLHLQYNYSLLDMSAACNGCGAKMTVEHALSCKTGGLVHIWHDDVVDEWRHLCGTALSPGQVKHKSKIFSSINQWVHIAAGNTTTPPSSTRTADTKHQPAAIEERVMPAAMGSGNAAIQSYLI
jgi:hypothetical protein